MDDSPQLVGVIFHIVVNTHKLGLPPPHAVELPLTLPSPPTCRSVSFKSSLIIWKATALSGLCSTSLQWSMSIAASTISQRARSRTSIGLCNTFLTATRPFSRHSRSASGCDAFTTHCRSCDTHFPSSSPHTRRDSSRNAASPTCSFTSNNSRSCCSARNSRVSRERPASQ